MGSAVKLGRLYVILDDTYITPENVESTALKILKGGADILQIRSKKWGKNTVDHVASKVREMARDFDVPLIINDYIDIASKYDGLHIGAEDAPYEEARKRLKDKIIGVSCYDSVEMALRMQEAGADYVAMSSPYPSPTKSKENTPKKVIRKAAELLSIPFYVIGGIDEERAKEMRRLGVYGVAVISAILKSDDPEEATRRLKDAVYSFA